MVAGILMIVVLAGLELAAGIKERSFSRVFIGIFSIAVGLSYFKEIRK